MRELIVAEFITLDGVIQAPGGADEDTEGGFTHGGWTQLKQQPGKNILVDGSSVLTRVLAHNDLVDEYSLHVYPIVLGGGKRLFPEGKRLDLKLVEASPLPTGVVFMRYRRTA